MFGFIKKFFANVSRNAGGATASEGGDKVYSCPSCGFTSNEPGTCPNCGAPLREGSGMPL